MTETFAQCPHCQASLEESDSHLDITKDIIRCEACLKTFSTFDIISSPEEAKQSNEPEKKTESTPPLWQLEDEDSLETLQPDNIAAIHEETIEINHKDTAPKRQPGLALALCGLIALLAVQFLWFNFEDITLDPRWSPVTNVLCKTLTCPEKEAFDLSQFIAEDIVVHPHSIYANALQVDFIFSNEASFDQNFPLAELNFTDTSGKLLATRQFAPHEYLPLELKNMAQMPANARIQTSLEILDPGQGASSYWLDFRRP